MPTNKKYTSVADIKETWMTNIAPNYFDMANINNYQTGVFGFITEVMANTTEDVFNAINIARREFYPTTAESKQSLYKMAAIQNIGLPMVTTGTTKAVLLVPVKEVIENSTFNDGIYTCVIDNTISILADNVPFILDYPIVIISKKNGAQWIHTSHYDIGLTNSLDITSTRYVMNKTIVENGVSYLLLSVSLRQASIENITKVIIKDASINTASLDFTFSGDLANFEVFYSESSGKDEIQLKKILRGGVIPQSPSCFYELLDDNNIRLTFPNNPYFTVGFNSEIRLCVYTSLGAAGNFDTFKGSLSCTQNSEKYAYNNSMTITGVINGGCSGGLDKPLNEEFRKKITDAYSTNNTITTSNDLTLYFESLAATEESTKKNKILFRKKRDDALIRLFGAYSLLKDEFNNVVPTNTLDVYFKRSQLSDNLTENRLSIKAGTLFEYRPDTNGMVVYDAQPVDKSDITIIDDLEVYDNNTKIIFSGIFANKLYVLTGSSGNILISDNGKTWNKRVSNVNSNLYDITYGKSLYVAIGDNGTIVTSPDGSVWTKQTSGTTTYLRGISYINAKFVACGDSGVVLSSTDGITWTSSLINAPVIKGVKKVAFGKGLYIAVGDDGLMASSPDLVTWTIFNNTAINANSLTSIIYAKNKFYAVGNTGTIISGTDNVLANWTTEVSNTTMNLHSIIFTNNMFLVSGNNGTIITGTDGVTWINRISNSPNNLNVVLYGANPDSMYVAAGENGVILNSIDSVNWKNKPIRFLFTNPFLIALTLNPNIVGYYLNSINTVKPVSYTYVNDSTLTQFIASSLKLKRNALMGENYYKLTLSISPASDLDPSTVIKMVDSYAVPNIIRAKKSGKVISFRYGTNCVNALVNYNDGTSETIQISSYTEKTDAGFIYHTGYNMKFDVGNTFIENDILATMKVTDLGVIRSVGDFREVLFNNNLYFPFVIEGYDQATNVYELCAYLSTDDKMTLDAHMLIEHGIFRSTGIEDDNVTIPMNKLGIDIHTFYNNPDINYAHKYDAYDYVKNYTLTNTYTHNEVDDLNKIALIQQVDFIRSVMTYTEDVKTPTDFNIKISEIPVAKAAWCKIYKNFEYLVNTIYTNYLNLYNTYFLLENNFGIDLKFYNTYGKSKFFKVGIRDDVSILDNVNCAFSFGVYLTSLTSSDIFITKFRNFVKDYIESINYVGSSGQSIYIMNMIAEAKVQFPEIGYIEYYGFNSYNYKTQKIEGLTDAQISNSGLREYIPEFINIRSILEGNDYVPKVDVILLEQ